MKSYTFKNGSGLTLRVIEDEIQNHFDNEIIIFGKNKKILEQVEQLTNTTPSIVDSSSITPENWGGVDLGNSDCNSRAYSGEQTSAL